MSTLAACGSSFAWGLCAVGFGLLPVWTTLLITRINRDVLFSEIDLLKSGAIIIFAITLTISVLVDYYLSRFRFQGRFSALMFNAFFPFSIAISGILIHIITVDTKDASLNISFVLDANIVVVILAVIFCVIQKICLVYHEQRGTV